MVPDSVAAVPSAVCVVVEVDVVSLTTVVADPVSPGVDEVVGVLSGVVVASVEDPSVVSAGGVPSAGGASAAVVAATSSACARTSVPMARPA